MKICSTCKLPDKKYYKNTRRPDGLQSYCVDCSKDRSSARYKNFTEEQKQSLQDRTKQKTIINKQFLWDYLKEHPCIDCGEKDPIVLEFDHLKDKSGCVSSLANQGLSLDRIKEEVEKCEVRCVKCHRRKTAIQFNWYKDIVR